MTSLTPDLAVIDGVPRVSSLAIADHFQKRHEQVLRKIRQMSLECPSEFNEHNFVLVEYTDEKGEDRPMYQLSRDGFTLLAMGFAGKKALAWKIRYIEAFNAMEKALLDKSRRQALRQERKKALSLPQPSYRDKCADVTAKMLKLRSDLFTISTDMVHVFRDPFWGPGFIPEDKKPFAEAMNYAIQCFFMAVNKDFEAMERLFTAYVEGEKLMNPI